MSDLGSATQTRARGVRMWIAASLLVAIPVAALALSAVNFLQAADQDALADRQEETAALLEKRLAATRGQARPRTDASAIYLGGATPALARAELQRLLVNAVETSGGRVIEAQDDDPSGAPELASGDRVRLRVTFDATNPELAALLHAVETGLPLLAVEKIEIRRLESGTDGDPEDPTLRVGVVVVGAGRFAGG